MSDLPPSRGPASDRPSAESAGGESLSREAPAGNGALSFQEASFQEALTELALSERRGGGRFPVEWAVDCVAEDTFLYAAITNISEMGIFVACDAPFEVGTQVSLRFQPDPEVQPLVLPGRVQWVNRVRPFRPSRNPGMGIQFVELSLDDRERLVEIIHTIAYVRDYSS